MPVRSWQDAVAILDVAAGPATAKQLALAKISGISIDPTTPRIVAAAILRVSLQDSLATVVDRRPAERFEDWLVELRRDCDPAMKPANCEEARAWIEHLYIVQRREALADLQLREGDIVETSSGNLAEVSSITNKGKIYFKGGDGQCAWPDLVTVKARADDQSKSAIEMRARAANVVAHRRGKRLTRFSKAKHEALSDYEVTNTLTATEIDMFERVIEVARDERPIQRFLENHQHMLTALLGYRTCYCVPQPRLGSEYVPDFLIAGVDSLGIRWVLVELETPQSGVYLRDGRQFDAKVRKAMSQIVDWRHWLEQNLAYAQNFKSNDGLGFVDIRPNSRAIVMVGRRSRLNLSNEAARAAQSEQNGIEIQTYDRVIDRLRGAISFSGPPSANPFLIPTLPTEDVEPLMVEERILRSEP